jgi:HSP20 family protein
MGETIMAIKDLIPWNHGRDVSVRRGDDVNPFLTLHREMNRLFDDVFRGFDLSPSGFGPFEHGMGWPHIEVSEAGNEVQVTAELPGLEEKDVDVRLSDGVLVISGEKKTESEDKDRLFSERTYGRFERRIPLDEVDEDKVNASFKNGVLTVTLPRSAEAKSKVRRIAINGR